MAIRRVKLCAKYLFDKAPCVDGVFICIEPTSLVLNNAPVIEGTLASIQVKTCGSNCCGSSCGCTSKKEYCYELDYDDAQLANPLVGITAANISGFICKGCETTYLEWLTTTAVPGTPLVVADTPTVDLTSTGAFGHNLQADVKISATAGNILVANADGLYVPPDALSPAISVTDTATVDLVSSGTLGHDLQANVKVSATAGNIVAVNADGIYVAAGVQTPLVANDSATVDFTTSGVDSHTLTGSVKISANAGNSLVAALDGLFVPTFAETPFVANDSASIDFNTSGANGHILTGVVKLSATAGNILVANPDGIYAAAGAQTPFVANDSTSINFTTSGVDNHTLTGTVIIDPVVGNILVSGPLGLSVATPVQTPLTVVDTALVNLTASGVDNHTLQADILPGANGQVLTTVAGVPTWAAPAAGAQTPITVVDTNGINLTASGVDSHTIQADVIIDPAVGNQLSLSGTGLFVAPAVSDSLVDNLDRTFTHTAVDGTTQNFCQGLSTVTPGAGCLGFGAENMIRTMTLNGCDLTVEAAPEHHHDIGGAALGVGAGGTANAIGSFGATAGSIIVNNPSNCRGALVLLWTIAVTNYILGNNDTVAVNQNGAFGAPPALPFGAGVAQLGFSGADNTVRITDSRNLYRSITSFVPAGGSLTFNSAVRYDVTAQGSPGGVAFSPISNSCFYQISTRVV